MSGSESARARASSPRVSLALAAFASLAATIALAGLAAATPAGEPAEHAPALLVGFRHGADAAEVAKLHARLGAVVVRRLPQIGVEVVQPEDPVMGPPAAKGYLNSPWVRYVEQDTVLHIVGATASADIRRAHLAPWSADFAGWPLLAFGLDARPNDPSFGAQWMHATIHSEDAWDLSHADGVVIAVVDTGVDCGHPDLQAACVAGYDVVNKDNDPTDDQGHGTIEAGVAAALVDNAVGVAGMAWGAKIMPVKAMRADGSGTNGEITEGILWAADHGARVINLSLGGNTPSQAMADAMLYADSRGAVSVAAMGNRGDSSVSYPAAYPKVIAVAATTRADSHASFSVYGDHCDVAAPGAEILTTRMGGGYYRYDGTSEATAVVSGLAALLAAQKPSRSPAEIDQLMKDTAVDLGPVGFDPYFGFGRVDAGAALAKEAALLPTATPTLPAPTAAPSTPPAAICQRRTLRIWAFPDTVGVAGPSRACNGCDGVFSSGDKMSAAACPLAPLTVQVSDANDARRVYWEGELPRASASAVDVQAYVQLCQPPPYLVTLKTTSTSCYRLCPSAQADLRVSQDDFDRMSRVQVGSGEGRLAEVRWFFWQCAP